jgi:hypothetical protein
MVRATLEAAKDASNCYSSGIAVNAKLESGAGAAEWSYGMTATTLAPPALDPWSNVVLAGSNDNNLHVMQIRTAHWRRASSRSRPAGRSRRGRRSFPPVTARPRPR